MEMAIANLSTAMATQEAMEQIGVSLLKKTLDQTATMGTDMASMIKSMELSVNPNVGSLFDMSI